MKPYAEVKLKSKKAEKKSGVHHVRVRVADNGGHVVEAHHESYDDKPETHSYGAHEGGDALRKVAELAGIKVQEPQGDDEDADDEE